MYTLLALLSFSLLLSLLLLTIYSIILKNIIEYKYTHCIAYVARIPWLLFLRIDGLWWWRVLELDKTGPKGRMHTASASNHESHHFNRFLLQNNSTGWGQVRDFVDFYIYVYAVYIKYIVLYIYRLHTYPKDSAVANNDFLIFLGAAQGGTKKKILWHPAGAGRRRPPTARRA